MQETCNIIQMALSCWRGPYFSNEGENNTWSICPVSPKSFGEKSGENARFNMTLTGGKKMSKLLFQVFLLIQTAKTLISLYSIHNFLFFFFRLLQLFFSFLLKMKTNFSEHTPYRWITAKYDKLNMNKLKSCKLAGNSNNAVEYL